MADDDEMSEIADALIITNLETAVFDDAALKSEFETAFKEYDSGATFNYLKSFRRARVNFSTTEATVQARLGLNDKVVCGQPIKCYFAQLSEIVNAITKEDELELCCLHSNILILDKAFSYTVPKSTDDHLHPPKPEKMFLISPPCSPPVGWEQHREAEPVINFELIQALSNLSPELATDDGDSYCSSVRMDPHHLDMLRSQIELHITKHNTDKHKCIVPGERLAVTFLTASGTLSSEITTVHYLLWYHPRRSIPETCKAITAALKFKGRFSTPQKNGKR